MNKSQTYAGLVNWLNHPPKSAKDTVVSIHRLTRYERFRVKKYMTPQMNWTALTLSNSCMAIGKRYYPYCRSCFTLLVCTSSSLWRANWCHTYQIQFHIGNQPPLHFDRRKRCCLFTSWYSWRPSILSRRKTNRSQIFETGKRFAKVNRYQWWWGATNHQNRWFRFE